MNYIGLSADRFRDEDIEFFSCIICSDIVINPKMCSTCNHIFCKKCIDEWLKTNKFCPFKCSEKEDMIFAKIPESIKTMYENLKIKCSKTGCSEILPLKDLFKHENNCGSFKCENFKKCGKGAPILIIDKRVCSEKCYIYLKVKNKEEVDKETLFSLIQNFSENLVYDIGAIRSFYCYWRRDFEEGRNEGLAIMNRDQEVENLSDVKCYKSAVGAYVRLSFFNYFLGYNGRSTLL